MFKKKYIRLSDSTIKQIEKRGIFPLITGSYMEKFRPFNGKTYAQGTDKYGQEISIKVIAKSRHYYGYRILWNGETDNPLNRRDERPIS